jgi:hypothetical protein
MLSSDTLANLVHVAAVPVQVVTELLPLWRFTYVYSALIDHGPCSAYSTPKPAPKPLESKFLPPEKLAVPEASVKVAVLWCDPLVKTPPIRVGQPIIIDRVADPRTQDGETVGAEFAGEGIGADRRR